jgi:L-alanine-DL-glutamate epimerase-like enolase superfamily enzyme
MKIVRIETVPLIAPLAREYRGSYYRMTHRATVITRIHTDDGLVGEAYAGDEDKSLGEIEQVVHQEIEPGLIGKDPRNINACWETSYPATFNILRDRRIGLVALAGVDAALWDLYGKYLGEPLWRLWGGYRSKIPMIVIGGYYHTPNEKIADEIAEYKQMGVAGIKFKVGGKSPADDAQRVRIAREAAGDDFAIAVDANQGWSVQDAVEFAGLTKELNLRWFEEPVQWQNDRKSMARVRNSSSIPICAGQSEFSPGGCRDLFEANSVDVCNFDASWSGGPTAWLRVAAMAKTYEVQMAHHEEPQVSSHLIASQSHGTYAECFHPDRDPVWWNLIANRPELVDGHIQLSENPGLGWQLNEDFIKQYRVQ